MKESKAMMKKEVAFMKKKGAPKSMIRHEEKEYGMKKGVKKMAFGGMSGGTFGGMKQRAEPTREPRTRAVMQQSTRPVPLSMYKKGGEIKKMAFGGMSGGSGAPVSGPSGPPTAAVGTSGGSSLLAQLGAGLKQRARPVQERGTRMAKGGSVGSFRKAADGVASKGKTKGKMVKMAYGGKC